MTFISTGDYEKAFKAGSQNKSVASNFPPLQSIHNESMRMDAETPKLDALKSLFPGKECVSGDIPSSNIETFKWGWNEIPTVNKFTSALGNSMKVAKLGQAVIDFLAKVSDDSTHIQSVVFADFFNGQTQALVEISYREKHDFNGNKVTNEDGEPMGRYWIVNAEGRALFTSLKMIQAASVSSDLRVRDLNTDGLPDVYLTERTFTRCSGECSTLYINNGTSLNERLSLGVSEQASGNDDGTGEPYFWSNDGSLTFHDFNHDGHADAILIKKIGDLSEDASASNDYEGFAHCWIAGAGEYDKPCALLNCEMAEYLKMLEAESPSQRR